MIDHPLKVFLTVARMGSFTRAAGLLNITQPAVTHQIKNLEQLFHTRLFIRSQNRISLTRSGEILLKYAGDINLLYRKAEEGIQEANVRVAGDIQLGASVIPATYMMPALIGKFKSSYPDVNVSMIVGNSKEVLRCLQDDVIELGLVSGPIPLLNFVTIPLYRDVLTAIVSPGHPWASRPSIRKSDLFDMDFISREVGSGIRDIWEKSLNLRAARRTLKTLMVLGSTEAAKVAVIEGLGFAIVSRLAIRTEVELGLLKEIPIEKVRMVRDFSAVFRSEKDLSVPAAKFKDFLEQELEKDARGASSTKVSPGPRALSARLPR